MEEDQFEENFNYRMENYLRDNDLGLQIVFIDDQGRVYCFAHAAPAAGIVPVIKHESEPVTRQACFTCEQTAEARISAEGDELLAKLDGNHDERVLKRVDEEMASAAAQMEIRDLLPCPFCGDRAGVTRYDGADRTVVKCGSCGAKGPTHEDLESARSEWNQRAVPKDKSGTLSAEQRETYVIDLAIQVTAWSQKDGRFFESFDENIDAINCIREHAHKLCDTFEALPPNRQEMWDGMLEVEELAHKLIEERK